MCLILDRNTYALSICFHGNLCPGYKISTTTIGVFHLLLLFYVWNCAVCLFVSPHTHVCTYRGHGLMLVIFLYLFSYTWFFETVSISQTKTHWLPGTDWSIGARASRISVSLSCLYVKNTLQKEKYRCPRSVVSFYVDQCLRGCERSQVCIKNTFLTQSSPQTLNTVLIYICFCSALFISFLINFLPIWSECATTKTLKVYFTRPVANEFYVEDILFLIANWIPL